VERPKYSTGFRVGFVMSGVCLLGLALFFTGARTVGLFLAIAGFFAGGNGGYYTNYRRVWSKTWPDDYPILAALTGTERNPERWSDERRGRLRSNLSPRQHQFLILAIGILGGSVILYAHGWL
jgi:hypothetical protein